MKEVSIIGLDVAKNVFQAHGTGADGSVIFSRKLSRAQLLTFLAGQGIRRKTRKQYSAEEKIRIVLAGLPGEESIAALCRREG